MTDQKPDGDKGQRSGEERRQKVRRDDDACALCEFFRDVERERHEGLEESLADAKATHSRDHAEVMKMVNEQAVAQKKDMGGTLPRWVFSLFILIVIGTGGWLSISSISQGNRLTRTETLIEVMATNISRIAISVGATPVHPPEQSAPAKK